MRSAPIYLGVFTVGAFVSLTLSVFVAGAVGGTIAIPNFVLTSVLFSAGLLVLSRWLLRREALTLRELGLVPTRRRFREFSAGFVVTGVLFLLATIAQASFVGAPWIFQGWAGVRAALLGVGINGVLVLSEELLFRGVALRYLRAMYGDRGAVVLSALLFGAYHLIQTNDFAMGAAYRLIMPTIGGLVFGWAAVRSQGLALPLGLHLGGNWIQFAVAGFAVSSTSVTAPVAALWRIPITSDAFRRLTAPDLLPHLPYLLAIAVTALIARRMAMRPDFSEAT